MTLSLQSKRPLIAGAAVCSLVVLKLLLFCDESFPSRWRKIHDGMTQAEVTRALGPPTSIGNGEAIGAGGQVVIRWEYRHGLHSYLVDFDYIGPAGSPVVFRTDSFEREWYWPSWWPWQRARARA